MRFLADMGVSTLTVKWLRSVGHDAVHLRELGLQRLPDEDILVKAREEGRIVLTMDLDFGYLLAISAAPLPSVVLFRLSDERAEFVSRRLANVLTESTEALVAGAIVSVSDTSIRVRGLPIGQ
jgi:predicted nuclease of predicted toxin-antitoxin system